MVEIDEQIDGRFELKQHIEFIRKDLLDLHRKNRDHTHRLYELYAQKDNEIKVLRDNVALGEKTRQATSAERDEAYEQLGYLFSERNMWLGFVSDNMAGIQH